MRIAGVGDRHEIQAVWKAKLHLVALDAQRQPIGPIADRRDPDADAKREERGQRTSHSANDDEPSGGEAEAAEPEAARRS